MKLVRKYQINYTILEEGTEIRIVEQRKKWANYNNAQAFLFEVQTGENKGFQWWDYLGNIRGAIGMPYKSAAPEVWLNMANDYIQAGWNATRIIRAGLVPKRYAHLVPQYIKYFDQLQNAPTI